MIKYDYRLERDETDEKMVYTPVLPKEIPALAYIQGPNSSGKSTFLNLIALAFFGYRLGPEELNPALIEKLANLSQAEHQKLEFSVELRSKNGDIILNAVKKANTKEADVRRTGSDGKSKPISFDQFKREFRLIYDIPQDPLSRLPLLLREIKIAQIDKGAQISRLKKRLDDIITEVQESKNPEKVAELHANVTIAEKRLSKLVSTKAEKEIQFRTIRNFCILKNYLDARNEETDFKAKIKRLETQIDKYKKAENKQSKELLLELRRTSECINGAEELHKKISHLLRGLIQKSDTGRLELWNELKCADEIKAGVDVRTIRDDSVYFENYLTRLLDKESNQKEEAEFLQNLLHVVENYKSQDFSIPGTNLSVKQFINTLRERTGSFKKVLIKTEQIKECQEALSAIRQFINDGVRHHTESLKVAKERGETAEQLAGDLENEELNETRRRLELCSKKLQDCKSKLVEFGIDYANAQVIYDKLLADDDCYTYISYSESQLLALQEDAERVLVGLSKDEENCKREIQVAKSEITRLEKLGTHKYQDYLIQLEHLYGPIQNLEKTIAVTFNKIINDMIDSKLKTVNEQEKKYCERIQQFLAAKIGSIRHISSSYKLKRVDVISKEIVTSTGKKIKFADLGTGQSQGAYIEGLLNSNDNKKIIALFDEVAMMDTQTLKPIFKKLQKMYNENKLLAGIVVQKRDEGILIKPLSDF